MSDDIKKVFGSGVVGEVVSLFLLLIYAVLSHMYIQKESIVEMAIYIPLALIAALSTALLGIVVILLTIFLWIIEKKKKRASV